MIGFFCCIFDKIIMVNKAKFRIKTLSRQQQIVWGTFCILFSVLLLIAFISFFGSWKADQSALDAIANRNVVVENSIRKLGASLSHLFIYQGLGIGAFSLIFVPCNRNKSLPQYCN